MEFSLEFSKRMIEAAECLKCDNLTGGKPEAERAILYLCLISCEISIKALLEKAGYNVIPDIKNVSHSFKKLIKLLCTCDFKEGTIDGTAARLLSISATLTPQQCPTTVGHVLSFEETSASIYPNQIRYGEIVSHYPASLMLECAIAVHKWASEHIEMIKRKES